MSDDKPTDPRTEAVKLLIEGLLTDGAHHKQWFLEQAFRALCKDAYVDEAKADFQWQEGQIP